MLQILPITNVQHIYGKVFRFQGTRPVSTIVIVPQNVFYLNKIYILSMQI
jgi:hypothetical protein